MHPAPICIVEATGNGEAAIFSGEGCTGDIILGWYDGMFFPDGTVETVYYVGGRVIGTEDVPMCKTITITQEEWVPDASPHLYFHGVEGSTTVGGGHSMIITTDRGGQVALFDDSTCGNLLYLGWIGSINTSSGEPTVKSAMARRNVNPDMTSPCYTITVIDDSVPIIPPVLTLNGSSTDVSVPVNDYINIVLSPNAELARFATADCAGEPMTKPCGAAAIAARRPPPLHLARSTSWHAGLSIRK